MNRSTEAKINSQAGDLYINSAAFFRQLIYAPSLFSASKIVENGSYKGVIKREAVYKCTNKDHLPEA